MNFSRHRLAGGLVLGIPILWIAVFMLLPYAIIFTYSFWTKQYPTFLPDFQFGNYINLINDPQYARVLLRTLKISLLVSLSALLLGYPFAYFLAFRCKSARLRTWLYMAVIAPLWVSYLLRAYVWKTILGTEGVLNSFLMNIGVLSEPSDLFLYNQFAMVITLTYIFVPFMVMPIYTALEKIPPNLLEASGDLGMRPFPGRVYSDVLPDVWRLCRAVSGRWTGWQPCGQRDRHAIRHRAELAHGLGLGHFRSDHRAERPVLVGPDRAPLQPKGDLTWIPPWFSPIPAQQTRAVPDLSVAMGLTRPS